LRRLQKSTDAEREETRRTLEILEAWIAGSHYLQELDVRRFFVVLALDESDDRDLVLVRDRSAGH